MPDYIGSNDIVKKYIGDQEVLKAYVGSTEIYTAATTTTTTTAAPASLSISFVGYFSGDVQARFSHGTLPANTTKLKATIDGTGSGDTNTTITFPLTTDTHNGPDGFNSFRIQYNSSTDQATVFHGPGSAITNLSVTLEALDTNDTTLATSNTLTGLSLNEDG